MKAGPGRPPADSFSLSPGGPTNHQSVGYRLVRQASELAADLGHCLGPWRADLYAPKNDLGDDDRRKWDDGPYSITSWANECQACGEIVAVDCMVHSDRLAGRALMVSCPGYGPE